MKKKRGKKRHQKVTGKVVAFLEPGSPFLRNQEDLNGRILGECVEHRMFAEVLDYQIGKTHPNLKLDEYNALALFWRKFAKECAKAALRHPPAKPNTEEAGWKRALCRDVAVALRHGGFERLLSENQRLFGIVNGGEPLFNHTLLHASIALRAAKIAVMLFHGLDPSLLRSEAIAIPAAAVSAAVS